jgi:hypothetical protein
MSLNDIATPAAREPGPLVTRCRSRTVANVDSRALAGVKAQTFASLDCCAKRLRKVCAAGEAVDGIFGEGTFHETVQRREFRTSV